MQKIAMNLKFFYTKDFLYKIILVIFIIWSLFIFNPLNLVKNLLLNLSFYNYERIYQNLPKENVGDNSLPIFAIEISKIIKAKKLTDYNLVINHNWHFQEIVANVWPSQYNEKSKNVFFLNTNKKNVGDCKIRENFNNVFLCVRN